MCLQLYKVGDKKLFIDKNYEEYSIKEYKNIVCKQDCLDQIYINLVKYKLSNNFKAVSGNIKIKMIRQTPHFFYDICASSRDLVVSILNYCRATIAF